MGSAALVGEYPAQAPPLGISPDSAFPNETFDLLGGCLYLYTDGLLEARVGESRLEREGLIRLFRPATCTRRSMSWESGSRC